MVRGQGHASPAVQQCPLALREAISPPHAPHNANTPTLASPHNRHKSLPQQILIQLNRRLLRPLPGNHTSHFPPSKSAQFADIRNNRAHMAPSNQLVPKPRATASSWVPDHAGRAADQPAAVASCSASCRPAPPAWLKRRSHPAPPPSGRLRRPDTQLTSRRRSAAHSGPH